MVLAMIREVEIDGEKVLEVDSVEEFSKAVRREWGFPDEQEDIDTPEEIREAANAVRISNKEIYRKLGIENVRHRREADDSVMLRRLLSLDYVLGEHRTLLASHRAGKGRLL